MIDVLVSGMTTNSTSFGHLQPAVSAWTAPKPHGSTSIYGPDTGLSMFAKQIALQQKHHLATMRAVRNADVSSSRLNVQAPSSGSSKPVSDDMPSLRNEHDIAPVKSASSSVQPTAVIAKPDASAAAVAGPSAGVVAAVVRATAPETASDPEPDDAPVETLTAGTDQPAATVAPELPPALMRPPGSLATDLPAQQESRDTQPSAVEQPAAETITRPTETAGGPKTVTPPALPPSFMAAGQLASMVHEPDRAPASSAAASVGGRNLKAIASVQVSNTGVTNGAPRSSASSDPGFTAQLAIAGSSAGTSVSTSAGLTEPKAKSETLDDDPTLEAPEPQVDLTPPLAQAGLTAAQPRTPVDAPPPIHTPLVVQLQPALRTLAAGAASGSRIVVSMNPKELGSVQVQLERAADGSVRIVVAASDPSTLRDLMSNRHQLHAALDAARLPTSDRQLTFEIAHDPHPGTDASGMAPSGLPSTSFDPSGSAGFNHTDSQMPQDERGRGSERQPAHTMGLSDGSPANGNMAVIASLPSSSNSRINITA